MQIRFFGNDPRGDDEFREANAIHLIGFSAAAMREALDIWKRPARMRRGKNRTRFVASIINDELRATGNLHVELVSRELVSGETRLELITRPRSLLGALWLQLATDVSQQAALLKCQQCHTKYRHWTQHHATACCGVA